MPLGYELVSTAGQYVIIERADLYHIDLRLT